MRPMILIDLVPTNSLQTAKSLWTYSRNTRNNKADLLTSHRVASFRGKKQYILLHFDRKQIRMHSTVVLLSKHDECCQNLTEKRDFLHDCAKCAKKKKKWLRRDTRSVYVWVWIRRQNKLFIVARIHTIMWLHFNTAKNSYYKKLKILLKWSRKNNR